MTDWRDKLLLAIAAVVGAATGALPFGSTLVSRVVRPGILDLSLVVPAGLVAVFAHTTSLADTVLATWLPVAVATSLRCGLEANEVRWRRAWMTPVFGLVAGLVTYLRVSAPAR